MESQLENVLGAAPGAELNRASIAIIFGRHRGAKSAVARATAIAYPQVSKWLAGTMTSARVADACRRMAVKIIESEQAGRSAKPIVAARKPGPKPGTRRRENVTS